MAITLLNGRITVQYEAGDPKGNSWSNPYTLDDIVAASIAGGWSPGVQMIDPRVFFCPYAIWAVGADTYFLLAHPTHTSLFYTGDPSVVDAYFLYSASGAHTKVGNRSGTAMFGTTIVANPSIASSLRRVYFLGDNQLYNATFDHTLYAYVYGTEDSNAIVEDCMLLNHQFGWATNGYTEMRNVQMLGGYYAMQAGGVAEADGLVLKHHSVGMLCQGGTPIMRNVKMEDNLLRDTYIRTGITGGTIVTFIDCEIDKTKMEFYVSGALTDPSRQYLKYTVTIKVIDAEGNNIDGASVKIIAQDDTEMFNDVTVNGEISTELLVYESWATVVDTILYTDEIDYSPFEIIIEKVGYVSIEYKDITIDEKMSWEVVLKPPTYAEPPQVSIQDEEPTTIAIIEVETE